MTAAEYEKLRTDPKYELAVVLNALSTRPSIRTYCPREALRAFAYTPMTYRGTLRT